MLKNTNQPNHQAPLPKFIFGDDGQHDPEQARLFVIQTQSPAFIGEIYFDEAGTVQIHLHANVEAADRDARQKAGREALAFWQAKSLALENRN